MKDLIDSLEYLLFSRSCISCLLNTSQFGKLPQWFTSFFKLVTLNTLIHIFLLIPVCTVLDIVMVMVNFLCFYSFVPAFIKQSNNWLTVLLFDAPSVRHGLPYGVCATLCINSFRRNCSLLCFSKQIHHSLFVNPATWRC